jgi:hypothetical protein
MNLFRRNLIKGLSSLPFVGSSLSATGSRSSQKRDDIATDDIALNVIRLFNTLELNYKLQNGGTYASREELFRASTVAWFVDAPKAKEHGLGRRFYNSLRLSEDEIIPGWKLSVVKSDNELGYFISLVCTTDSWLGQKENSIFVSDEIGVIFVGGPEVNLEAPTHYRRAASVPGVRPIDQIIKQASLVGLLRRVAFATAGAPSPQGSCGCFCTCSSSGQCYCWNQGCKACAWCCTLGCAECVLYCGGNCACC